MIIVIIVKNNTIYIYIFISWVWPIVCNSFHKLEHDFGTEGNTKEHDFCTEGNTKGFLHGGEHQRARSRARFLHGGEHQRARSRARFFARRGTPKKQDPDHDFVHEGEQFSRNPHQKARARARFLHGGEHRRIFARRGAPTSTIFARRGAPKKHDPDHDFVHEGEQFSRNPHQKARARARFLHGGEHQRARSRARFLHEGEQNSTI